jgi:hypothetical protein
MSGLPQGSASGSPKDCLRIGARDRFGVGDGCSEGCFWSAGGAAGGVGGGSWAGSGCGFVNFGRDTEGVGRSGGPLTLLKLEAIA